MNSDRTLIIIPTYDECENVGPLVREVLARAPEADVLILDDNSPDGTADHAERLFGRDPRFSVLRRTGARGYGRSLIDGYRHALAAGYARVLQMDADFSHDPAMIPSLLAAARDSDVVIGSRYCAGGGVANWPLRRRALSRFANRYVAIITGLRVGDATSGFRCYTQRALRVLLEGRIRAEGYAFLVEATFRAHRAGLRLREVPIIFTDRREGRSKISRKVILESVLMPWRLRLAQRRDNDMADGGWRMAEGADAERLSQRSNDSTAS